MIIFFFHIWKHTLPKAHPRSNRLFINRHDARYDIIYSPWSSKIVRRTIDSNDISINFSAIRKIWKISEYDEDKVDDRGTERIPFRFDGWMLGAVRSPRGQKACYSRPARCPREWENAHCERQWEHSDAEEKVIWETIRMRTYYCGCKK